MKACNENNKDYVSSNNLPESEFKKYSHPFFVIIMGVLGPLMCGFILFITYSFIRYSFVGGIMCRNCFLDLAWHILYSCLIGLGIGAFISLGAKENNFTGKKVVYILIILCPLLAYLFFVLAIYYIYDMHYGDREFNFRGFIFGLYNSALDKPLRFQLPRNAYIATDMDYKMYEYTYYILKVYRILTLGKVDTWDLACIINIQAWFIQYIITVYCAWRYTIFSCPWLSPSNSSEMNRKGWVTFFIKKLQRRLFY